MFLQIVASKAQKNIYLKYLKKSEHTVYWHIRAHFIKDFEA